MLIKASPKGELVLRQEREELRSQVKRQKVVRASKKVLIEETKTATIEHNQDHDTPFKSEPEDIEMTDNDQTWGTRCLGRRK